MNMQIDREFDRGEDLNKAICITEDIVSSQNETCFLSSLFRL